MGQWAGVSPIPLSVLSSCAYLAHRDSWVQLEPPPLPPGSALGGDLKAARGAGAAGLVQGDGSEVPKRQSGVYSSSSAFICSWPSRAMRSMRARSGIGRSWVVKSSAASNSWPSEAECQPCLPASEGMAAPEAGALLARGGLSPAFASASMKQAVPAAWWGAGCRCCLHQDAAPAARGQLTARRG